jgi:hypothetical protein
MGSVGKVSAQMTTKSKAMINTDHQGQYGSHRKLSTMLIMATMTATVRANTEPVNRPDTCRQHDDATPADVATPRW